MLEVFSEQPQLKSTRSWRQVLLAAGLLPIILSSVLSIGYVIKHGLDPPWFATYSHVTFSCNLV